MGTTGNLKDIIKKQKEALLQLEAECHVIENSDLILENEKLKVECDRLRTDCANANGHITMLEDENKGLKNALYEQIYNEKTKIINSTEQKMEVYFKANITAEKNRLAVFENGVRIRINEIAATLRKHNIDTKDEIYRSLDELVVLLNKKITSAQEMLANTKTTFSDAERNELEAMKKESITEEQVRAIVKKNNFERFIGLNLLNAVGIFLLIIGVITAARYTYVRLPDLLKGIMMFSFGGIMLFLGEFMNRKKPNVFSLGLTAGGIAVLYVALATSFFGLRILSAYPAIAVCILITAVAFVLSRRYHSQMIMIFALIGGYLPMFSIGSLDSILYGAMLYFMVLNLLALLISFSKKWKIASYIGLVLNIFGTIYICFLFEDRMTMLGKVTLIAYVLFAFLVYTLIPLVSTYRTKARFQTSDVVLLAINTFFSSLIMYGVFYSLYLAEWNGLLTIVFALIYLFLGWVIEKKYASEERHMKVLFYLTGLAFVVLVIPFQFGVEWLSLGWLAEGVLFTSYGILNNEKIFKRAGLSISGMCLAAFLLFDCLFGMDSLFSYKYFALTVGSLIILGVYLYKGMMADVFVKVYKYFVIANVWFFLLYSVGRLHQVLRINYGEEGVYNIGYLIMAVDVIGTFLMAYCLPRIKRLSDLGTKIMAIVFYIIGILWLFFWNNLESPLNTSLLEWNAMTVIGTFVLVGVGLLSVFAVRDLMHFVVLGQKRGMEWYSMIVSGYFVLILTQNLIAHYYLSFSSAVISIIYVVAALAWIIYGFVKRYSFVRRFGLGLAILAVIKLFLIDLFSLTQGYRIITYFALGITLVAISFVYQYFNKRLELKEGVSMDA